LKFVIKEEKSHLNILKRYYSVNGIIFGSIIYTPYCEKIKLVIDLHETS